MTVEEYLEGERLAKERHEYIAGRVYAMAGASHKHNLIAGNIFVRLRQVALERGCLAYMSDMKLRSHEEVFYYPDVMMVCEASKDSHYETAPLLVVEVMSETTAQIDKREKLNSYQRLPSLMSYLLVDSGKRGFVAYHRLESGC
ncbi:MAG: Uma2 family endonuclease [Deinococcales bacterium]